jgi:alcohol dehydrogenase YqhD (iron-dependent ADH family)
VFFERLTVRTRLRDYEIGGASIGSLVAKLEQHGMTALGEHGCVTKIPPMLGGLDDQRFLSIDGVTFD